MNKILCIGAGYVGGPTMAMISYKCPEYIVKVVDINQKRIEAWNSQQLPIFEPGLDNIVFKTRNVNLFFEEITQETIDWADIIFVSVNTPTKTFGEGSGYAADLQYWEKTARQIAAASKNSKIVVEKSTLPVNTAEAMLNILNSGEIKFEVISNPEFLAEGTAMKDLENPDRVLIGGNYFTETGRNAIDEIVKVYSHWVPKEKIITSNVWSSELSKLVSNAFLAQRISSINTISKICEVTRANIDEVSKAVGMDSRIGPKFLKAGIGFGGSCFKKDILNLVYLCRQFSLNEIADYWENVVKINDYQKNRFTKEISNRMFNTIADKKIIILGTAFKADTGDVRESPAFTVCRKLLDERAILYVHDFKAYSNFISEFVKKDGDNLFEIDTASIRNPLKSMKLSEADALVVLTDWEEYKKLNFEAIYSVMRKPAFIFDGRNFLNHMYLREIGFKVFSIGKN